MNNQAVEIINPRETDVAPRAVMTPLDMLDRAVVQGASVEVMTKLLDLHERTEAIRARRAFDEAIAAAKGEIPVIRKNREVDFTSSKGRTNYRHEDLAEIARTVDPVLSKYGLSYRFRTTSVPNEPIVVTCVVSHRLGYSEENSLTAGRDDSGNKNSIQAIGSAISYLMRYTLKAALGLAASVDDDDGSGSEKEEPGTITDEQFASLRAMIDEVGADIPKFCRYFKIEGLQQLPASRYADAVKQLALKRAREATQQAQP